MTAGLGDRESHNAAAQLHTSQRSRLHDAGLGLLPICKATRLAGMASPVLNLCGGR